MELSRFTDRARRVVHLAEKEAAKWQHKQVWPLHLLVGLLREGSGVGGFVLRELAVSPSRLRECLIAADYPKQVVDRPSHTEIVDKILQQAEIEARELKDGFVGTEHILLAYAAAYPDNNPTLEELKITSESLRISILNLLGVGRQSPETAEHFIKHLQALQTTIGMTIGKWVDDLRGQRPAVKDVQVLTLTILEQIAKDLLPEHQKTVREWIGLSPLVDHVRQISLEQFKQEYQQEWQPMPPTPPAPQPPGYPPRLK